MENIYSLPSGVKTTMLEVIVHTSRKARVNSFKFSNCVCQC